MARLISILCLVSLVIAVSEAREIVVGGRESKTFWRVPGGNLTNLDYWAEQLRFSPGDVLGTLLIILLSFSSLHFISFFYST